MNNKSINLYMYLIILITSFAFFIITSHPNLSFNVQFPSFVHKAVEVITTIIFFLIFLKANNIYSKTDDERMAIIGGGFLVGSLLNLIHIMSNLPAPYDIMTTSNINKGPYLIYLLFNELIISISLFYSIFYRRKKDNIQKNKFRNEIYSVYLGILFLALISGFIIINYLHTELISRFIVFFHTFGVINETLLILTTFIYTNMSTGQQKPPFPMFILGLFLLSVSGIFYINPIFIPLLALIAHVIKLMGFILIFVGLNYISIIPKLVSIKDKLTAYISLTLIFSYILFVSLNLAIFNTKFPPFTNYIFLEFLLIYAIAQYALFNRFFSSINSIIKSVEKYNPEQKPETIYVRSGDEVETLANRLNLILNSNWNFIQEVLNKQKRIQELSDVERTLLAITKAIKVRPELEQVLTAICQELLNLFKVDKVAIVSYPDLEDYSKWSLLVEYNVNSSIPKMTIEGLPQETKQYLTNYYLEGNNKMKIEDIETSDYPEHFKNVFIQAGIKSILSVSIKKEKNEWGILGIFSLSKREWTEGEVILLDKITDQIYIAIRQAELYTKIRKLAEREILLRKTIEKIRSSLDINETLTFICDEVAKLFKVQRATIAEFCDIKNFKNFIVRREYKIGQELKGFTDTAHNEETAEYWGSTLFNTGKIISIDNISDSDTPDNFKQYYNEIGVKSIIGSAIKKETDFWGTIVLSEYNYYRRWTLEEKLLLDEISAQIYIAIKQAELYNKEKQESEKKDLLNEIIRNIRLSQNIDKIYEYIVTKLSNTFNSNRVIFIESPSSKFEKPFTKYEYLENKQLPSLKKIKIPDSFLKELQKIAKNSDLLRVNNVQNYYKNKEAILEFLENYSINSFMLVPFARDKTLGYFMVCSSKSRDWGSNEADLFKSISESIIDILLETTKLIEIAEIRSTFALTLAHDIQVPLVGYKKMLEYLASRKKSESIGKYTHFIDDAIESNNYLLRLLNRLLDSYNYELGNKKLELKQQNISFAINEVVDSLRSLAESKSITLNIELPEDLPEICIDKEEFKKAIYNILENALTYTHEGGYTAVSGFKLENSLSICISDNGPGLTLKERERLFERYAMTRVIERKIGSGLGLYLSKQIVEAHKGYIFYSTEVGEGSTFCTILPILS